MIRHLGGTTVGFFLDGAGPLIIANNTLYRTSPGPGDDCGGPPGQSAGIGLAQATSVSVVNNVVAWHGVGISATLSSPPVIDHNDLWQNETDYAGATPGVRDLHVDPRLSNPEGGDFRLAPDSPLIDARTNRGAPDYDFEGDRRAVDGGRDGAIIADVGADEYSVGLDGSRFTVDRTVVQDGDTLSYRLEIHNARLDPVNSAHGTITLPVEGRYLNCSLCASGGQAVYANSVIEWSATLAPGAEVTVAFQVLVDLVCPVPWRSSPAPPARVHSASFRPQPWLTPCSSIFQPLHVNGRRLRTDHSQRPATVNRTILAGSGQSLAAIAFTLALYT